MFIHTRSGAPKIFAKFGWKQKSGKSGRQTRVRQTIAKSGRAKFLELLFWTGIFKSLDKT